MEELEIPVEELDVPVKDSAPVYTGIEVTDEGVEQSLADLNDLLLSQQKRYNRTQYLRTMLLDKMTDAVFNMKIEPGTKGWSVQDSESAAIMLNEYRSLMNDIDKADLDIVKTRIKVKDMETNRKATITAAEFFDMLKKSNMGTLVVSDTAPDLAKAEEALDNAIADGDFVVADTELTVGGNKLPKDSEEEE